MNLLLIIISTVVVAILFYFIGHHFGEKSNYRTTEDKPKVTPPQKMHEKFPDLHLWEERDLIGTKDVYSTPLHLKYLTENGAMVTYKDSYYVPGRIGPPPVYEKFLNIEEIKSNISLKERQETEKRARDKEYYQAFLNELRKQSER